MEITNIYIIYLVISILIYYAALSIWYTVTLIAAFPEVIRKFKEAQLNKVRQLHGSDNILPVTVITPAYNEEKRILNMIYSGLRCNYKNIKFIIVNDGSTDSTLELLKKEFLLYEVPVVIKQRIKTSKIISCYKSKRFNNLTVLDKEHSAFGCASDSVNVGLNACDTPIALTIDADTVIEPEALTRMVFTFLSRDHCVTVGGSVYVLNENRVVQGELLETNLSKSYVPAFQSVEYLRSFLYGRAGLNLIGGAFCYPGAFTLFETELLRDVGGFDPLNYAYDTEMTAKIHHWMRKHKYPHYIAHSPDAFCWTEVPGTAKSYWKQRDKWQRGMLRSAQMHIEMLFNPKYGFMGLITFPTFILFEIFAPVVEFISITLFLILFILGEVNLPTIAWFIFLAWGYISLLSLGTIFLNFISFNKYHKAGDILRIIWFTSVEMLGFRELRAIDCTMATVKYFINRLLGKPL